MRARGSCLLLLVLALSGAAGAADFLGPESCKGCHPAAYEAWMQSKHARAGDSLSDAQKTDARCLSCHAPDQGSQGVSHVTCETCHGGGQYYSPAYVMKDAELARLVGLVDPSEKSCRGRTPPASCSTSTMRARMSASTLSDCVMAEGIL